MIAGDAHQPGTAVIAEMITQKLKMSTTYRVRFRVESRQYVGQHVGRSGHTVSIWRAGEKLRIDTTESVSDTPPPFPGMVRPGGDGSRQISCYNCERPGYYLHTSVAPGNPKVTQIVAFDKTPAFATGFPEYDIDWRLLGMTNNVLRVYRLADVEGGCKNYLTNPKMVLSQAVRNLRPCLVSALTTPTSQSETHFSSGDGYNPIYRLWVYDKDQGRCKRATEIDWHKTPGNHLYPSRIKLSDMVGDQLESNETVTVIDADFHNPIDPVMFTVAGMNLNDGQLIAYPDVPAAEQPIWRNGGLVPR